MGFYKFIGYDKDGEISTLSTTLNKEKLNTFEVVLAALGFNAPAWVAASSMSILYLISGQAAPLTILIAYFFPMLTLALCMVYLIRHAPSAGGIFTFAQKFIHPHASTILGWSYVVACSTVTAMTTVIGSSYIQTLIPSLKGEWEAKIIGTILLLFFLVICLRGIELTAKVAGVFLIFEITVVAGLGICGIVSPHVENQSFFALYSPSSVGGWSIIGPGVLFGVWMLANFDSAINLIEEAKVPVRTIQRSLVLVLSIAFVVYSLAAIGWQYAVPVKKLAAIVENGNGGPIAAVAQQYLPSSLSWIAIFVVITSATAGLQISMTSGSRAAYRMSVEGHLPMFLSKVNKHKVPWIINCGITIFSIIAIWIKPISKLQWYYDVVTATLVLSYVSVLMAFILLIFKRKTKLLAVCTSILPLLAIAVLSYIFYTAGAKPAVPSDLYHAWYLGGIVVVSGIGLIIYEIKSKKIRNNNNDENLEEKKNIL
ncbi:amino acid permease [Terrilactibacillus sp. BCM23-1]|uniref:Amino acid permease n=1 Tax=Terrilactibacillus tamarindi TaxID=2599694 RepID=A0A6N8CRD3_9BACI|nr:APC family permease [Terrilactibacillus tamarindi]MTT32198.1 amino acid permease [Terrilactibacillus tamarindi]